MLSEEQIVKKWVSTSLTVSDFIEAIRSIEREAYKQGQERMRERVLNGNCSLCHDYVRNLEIEEPK